MDSLQDLLAKRSRPEPPEIAAIKAYVAQHFSGRTVKIRLMTDSIIITVTSAAFAGSLRLHTRQLQAAADTTKRISYQIG